jgi:hypothetical protein
VFNACCRYNTICLYALLHLLYLQHIGFSWIIEIS